MRVINVLILIELLWHAQLHAGMYQQCEHDAT